MLLSGCLGNGDRLDLTQSQFPGSGFRNSRYRQVRARDLKLDDSNLQEARFQDSGSPYFSEEPNLIVPGSDPTVEATADPRLAEQLNDRSNRVAEIRITGNQRLAEHQILRAVRTRPGRFFDPDLLQQDVDELWRHNMIRRINGPFLERTDRGIIVTIDVVERQYVDEIQFIGNRALTDRKLRQTVGIEAGSPLDTHSVRMAKQQIEDLYREQGFNRTQVEILEGSGEDDHQVTFLIHEDTPEKVFRISFEGNSIASDARLAKFVKSKPGVLWLFGGKLNRNQLDEDILRLTHYYRSLGFFNARVGRELQAGDGTWVSIKYVIDEGQRFRVRNVSFVGNNAFTAEQLWPALKLKPTESEQPFYDEKQKASDTRNLTDAYGTQGFVFANVEAEIRFLEEPGLVDLVYRIEEGKQYRVGKINVVINGDYGVTKRQVIYNRIGLRPGDLIDSQKLRAAENQLTRSQLFTDGTGSSPGPPPQVVVVPPELDDSQRRRY